MKNQSVGGTAIFFFPIFFAYAIATTCPAGASANPIHFSAPSYTFRTNQNAVTVDNLGNALVCFMLSESGAAATPGFARFDHVGKIVEAVKFSANYAGVELVGCHYETSITKLFIALNSADTFTLIGYDGTADPGPDYQEARLCAAGTSVPPQFVVGSGGTHVHVAFYATSTACGN